MSSTAKQTIFQALYDSEINFSVSCFWDDGFEVKIGDAMNGYSAEANVRVWPAVEVWLKQQALRLYPDSDFAKWVAATEAQP